MSLGSFLSWHNYEILVEKLQRQRLTVCTSLASKYSRQQKLLAASARPSPNRSIQARAEVKASLRATCDRTHAHPQYRELGLKRRPRLLSAWRGADGELRLRSCRSSAVAVRTGKASHSPGTWRKVAQQQYKRPSSSSSVGYAASKMLRGRTPSSSGSLAARRFACSPER